jgi:hypothetical protein
MRQIVFTKTFKNFSELTEEEQQKVIEKNRSSIGNDATEFVNDDYSGSLNEFEKFFGIKIDRNVYYDSISLSTKYQANNSYGDHVMAWGYRNWEIDTLVEELEGKQLFRWLTQLFDGLKHKKYATKSGKERWSKIFVEPFDFDYGLSGLWCDSILLRPFKEFLERPKEGVTLDDLMTEALGDFSNDYNRAIENCYSDEYVREELEMNDVEFCVDDL